MEWEYCDDIFWGSIFNFDNFIEFGLCRFNVDRVEIISCFCRVFVCIWCVNVCGEMVDFI